jgi:hypothetical protein
MWKPEKRGTRIMATKQKQTMREFKVYRYWPVEYRSIAWVKATTPEVAARLALEDDDYDDAESCPGSDGPTEIGQVIEITPDGLEIEHDVAAPGQPVPAAEMVGATPAAALIAAAEAAIHRSIERQEMGGSGGVLDDDIFQMLAAAVRQCK